MCFFRGNNSRKEKIEKQIMEDFHEITEPILNLLGERVILYNFVLEIKYHDDFIIKYDFEKQTMYINEKYYYNVEEQDLFETLSEVNSDRYFIVEYKFKKLRRIPYFRFLSKKNTDANKIRKTKNVLRIFDINGLIYNESQARWKCSY